MSRNLVTIRTVAEIKPIANADMIELAVVDGWQLVTKKGEFKVGDRAVYLEIDSFLPCRPEFEFLRRSSYKKMGEEEGFRLKSIKLRGEISQGLLLPLSVVNLTGDENDEDLASLLGVTLYEPPIPAQLAGKVVGMFPSFIQKTDQERVQNLTGKLWGKGETVIYTDGEGNEIVKEIPPAVKRSYEVSEKMDGCFHYSTLVTTDLGKLTLGVIVNQKMDVKVLTYNEETKRTEYKEIDQYHYYKDKAVNCVVSVGHRGKGNRAKQIKCTQDHLFFTENGWKEAKDLQRGDIVFHSSENIPYEVKQLLLGCLLGDYHPGSYDLTLKDNHNYFVYDILVHNSSCTIFNYGDQFGVCSRNLQLEEDPENSFWKMAIKYNLKEKLSGHNVAIQGELCGEGIQKNKYKLKGQDLFVFDIFDIETHRYFSPEERLSFLSKVAPELKSVPILERDFDLPDDIGDLLTYAQGASKVNPQQEREGLVFKEEGTSLDRFSFKAISNKFLLAEKD